MKKKSISTLALACNVNVSSETSAYEIGILTMIFNKRYIVSGFISTAFLFYLYFTFHYPNINLSSVRWVQKRPIYQNRQKCPSFRIKPPRVLNFKFIINNDICNVPGVSLVTTIHSAAQNTEARSVIRWGPRLLHSGHTSTCEQGVLGHPWYPWGGHEAGVPPR